MALSPSRLGQRGVLLPLAAALLLTCVPWPAARATETFSFSRLAGSDRYATAATVATDAFTSATGAIIATGETFPDALAASFVAGYVNSPILLVERTRIPAPTVDALAKLGVKEVVLLGGTAAISEEVERQLDETYDVLRLFGPDRFATAANIALAVNPGDIGELDGKRTAFLAYGYNFADALAVGPLSYHGRLPILLNGSGGLGTPARIVLDRLDIAHVVLVGGEAVISDAARREIEEMGLTTSRLGGADRFATAAAVADLALAKLDFVDDHVNLTRGIDRADARQGFADALGGSVHAGRERAPLLLTDALELSAETRRWLETRAARLTTGDILGGEAAVSSAVEQDALATARSAAGPVVEIDTSVDRYSFVPEGTTGTVVVEYLATDAFTVDGATATVAGFETALSTGDQVRLTPTQPRRHDLVDRG